MSKPNNIRKLVSDQKLSCLEFTFQIDGRELSTDIVQISSLNILDPGWYVW